MVGLTGWEEVSEKNMIKDILIIGGTSGLGLELAERYAKLGHRVVITGRTDPKKENLKFVAFDVGTHTDELKDRIEKLITEAPTINTLIYVAGYYQEGLIDQLRDEDIFGMINIGLTAPALLIHRLKNNPSRPLKVMLITSSAQYTPRALEPLYAATKAGLGMLGACLGLDQELGKVLVVAPSGMKTPFWDGQKDISEFLDPSWVAEEIVELSSGPFKYKYAKILRGPQRVEVVEVRES